MVCSGCGTKGGWLPVPDGAMGEPCNRHDFYYWRGGTSEDRKAADRRFLRDMLSVARSRARWKRPAAFSQAYIYYRAVRAFGGLYFSYGQERGVWDLLKLEARSMLNRQLRADGRPHAGEAFYSDEIETQLKTLHADARKVAMTVELVDRGLV